MLLQVITAQGSFQILNIPSSTRLLSLSNSGHAYSTLVNSYNPASLKSEYTNFNFQSHVYPANIIYVKSEVILPIDKNIYSLEYSNLNYGEFHDANSNYSFNSSDFLFKGSIKTQLMNKISVGGTLGYSINKISNQYAHALFISLGARTQLADPTFGLGLSINNLGLVIKSFNDYNEKLPSSITLSTFYQPQYFPGVLFCDFYNEVRLENFEIRLGIESVVYKSLAVRLGYNTNSINLVDSHSSYLKGISGGFGITTQKWDVDIGFYNLETAGLISSLSLVYKR